MLREVNRELKILIASDTALPTINGISIFIDSLAEQLSMNGHRVHLVAPKQPNSLIDENIKYTIIRAKSYPCPFHKYNRISPDLNRFYSKNVISELRPDIVHLHTPWFIGESYLKSSMEYNIPTVYTHHIKLGNFIHYVPHITRLFAPAYFWNKVIYMCRNSDIVTSPSKSGLRYITDKVNRTDIKIIPNGVNLIDASKLELRYRGRIEDILKNIPAHGNIVMYAGRLDKDKGIDDLIKVVTKLCTMIKCFVIICGGGTELDSVRKRLSKFVDRGLVAITGNITHDEVMRLHRHTKVMMVTGVNETQPLVVLEAMTSGLPVVGFAAGGLVDLVHDGMNGYLVDYADIDRFCHYIIELLRDDQHHQRLSEISRRLVSTHSISAVSSMFQQVYEELILQRCGRNFG